ncbi:MAG TPA: site-specific integrase [Candidatus Sulfotelmatobacter sp.]|nr:site-specific integrase [Candidatus Sulfotelmatobacter sp.]
MTENQVGTILALAKKNSPRDHAIMTLMRWGLRVGEIVGCEGLPGIHSEDIRSDGIWVKGKGYKAGIVQDSLVPIPASVIKVLKGFSSDLKPGEKVFQISERQAERVVKNYARLSGVEDWRFVGPHRLRAFFATDAKDKGKDGLMIKDLMRHKNLATTEIYVGRASPQTLRRVVEELAEQVTN